MPTVTRHKVFETNSSSTHSISIQQGDFKPDRLSSSCGALKIFAGEFGWEHDTHSDPLSKASYCLTYVKTGGDQDGSREAMLREVLEEETGEKVEFVPIGHDTTYGPDWGYIDHQSHFGDRDACGYAFESKESLRAFIFNPKSFLVTDNDNH